MAKPFRVKNPSIESLAIQLFNEDGQYGAGWLEVSDTTRDRYRDMATGERDLPNNIKNTRPLLTDETVAHIETKTKSSDK
jgi:hypothetical protein